MFVINACFNYSLFNVIFTDGDEFWLQYNKSRVINYQDLKYSIYFLVCNYFLSYYFTFMINILLCHFIVIYSIYFFHEIKNLEYCCNKLYPEVVLKGINRYYSTLIFPKTDLRTRRLIVLNMLRKNE